MDEFKRQDGHLSGREERNDAFGGEPKAVGGSLGGTGARVTTSLTDRDAVSYGSHGGQNVGTTGAGVTSATTRTTGTSSSTATSKPSLIDRLNPKKDADGDGKAGIMK